MGKFEQLYTELIQESISKTNLDRMINSYLQTALWSSTNPDDNDSPLDDKYNISDFTKSAKTKSEQDCKKFVSDLEKELEKYNKDKDDEDKIHLYDLSSKFETPHGKQFEMLGHNFWLTRNGHGAGFFDGDYDDDIEKILTKLSDKAGTVDLYVTDDNEVDMM